MDADSVKRPTASRTAGVVSCGRQHSTWQKTSPVAHRTPCGLRHTTRPANVRPLQPAGVQPPPPTPALGLPVAALHRWLLSGAGQTGSSGDCPPWMVDGRLGQFGSVGGRPPQLVVRHPESITLAHLTAAQHDWLTVAWNQSGSADGHRPRPGRQSPGVSPGQPPAAIHVRSTTVRVSRRPLSTSG